MKIMIVDDNAQVRSSIRRLLIHTADSFSEFSDGGEAVDAYPEIRPDWVLMDVRMKTMDGFQATKQILASFPDAKIIMVTQYNDPALMEKAMQSGVKDYVLKENLIDLASLIQGHSN